MSWQDVFENEKTHARESVAAIFQPLADELAEIAQELAALRRGIETELGQ